MGLLQDEYLRRSVVELLSLMSLDATGKRSLSIVTFGSFVTHRMLLLARETMILRIASIAFGPDNPALVGHIELLARLISDGVCSLVVGSGASSNMT